MNWMLETENREFLNIFEVDYWVICSRKSLPEFIKKAFCILYFEIKLLHFIQSGGEFLRIHFFT